VGVLEQEVKMLTEAVWVLVGALGVLLQAVKLLVEGM
jgi:hypothetical protein